MKTIILISISLLLAEATIANPFSRPFTQPRPQAPTAPVVSEVPLSFVSPTPFSTIRIRAKRFEQTNPIFGENAFQRAPSQTCYKVRNGNFVFGETEVFYMNPLHYATSDTALRLANALGAQVLELKLEGFPCWSADVQYELLFQTGGNQGRRAQLNAGLVAKTFNTDSEWLALIRIRSEIAREFGMTVPTWNDIVRELSCGRAVLGVYVEFDSSFGVPTCR